jgi:leucyl-tRNA synthetase
LRATLELARGAEGPALEEQILALPGVVRAMDGKIARKVIVIPNKVVNIVI